MLRKLYMAYGSNLNREQMAHRCPTAKIIGTTVLEDYQLKFRGSRYGAVATVEPKKGSSVPALLWSITMSDEAALDWYEGWPDFYRKEDVQVKLNGKDVTAMVYIMNEGRPLGLPGSYYYFIIEEGYRSAGFSLSALRKAVDVSMKEGT